MAEKQRRYTIQEKESTLIRSALAVLLERMGGEMTYTDERLVDDDDPVPCCASVVIEVR